MQQISPSNFLLHSLLLEHFQVNCPCRIHMAPFNDEYLYVEIANKVTLKFYGLGLGDVAATKNSFGFSTSVADSGS